MPRQSRLDAPGTLHHVIGRGIKGSKIFRDRGDRENFLDRLAKLCEAKALSVYAWALLGTHFHLLVRSGNQSLSQSMRKLLTGYGDRGTLVQTQLCLDYGVGEVVERGRSFKVNLLFESLYGSVLGVRASLLNRVTNAEERFNIDQYMQ